MIRIRLATPDEAEAIRAVERSAGERFRAIGLDAVADAEVTPAAALIERASAGRLFVAEEDGRLCGFAMFSDVDGVCYLEEVSVAATHQGRRIGRDLIAAVEDAARSRGLAWITLSTFRDVPWNAPYYARLGFVEWPEELPPGHRATYERQARSGLDMSSRLFMRKPLQPAPGEGRIGEAHASRGSDSCSGNG